MIEAKRIDDPEFDRPDLYTMVQFIPNAPADSVCATMSSCRDPWPTRPEWTSFRLPGTRREKLTKALMEELEKWKAHPCKFTSEQLDAAYAALLALDAEGVKP